MKYSIPEGLDKEALIDIHEDFLSMNPDIRVNNRWGNYTEYSVRIRAKLASHLIDREAPGELTWRLCVGVDEPIDGVRDDSCDVQYHDGTEWITACYDPIRNEILVSAVHLITEARKYLIAEHPALQALLEIDRRLLDM